MSKTGPRRNQWTGPVREATPCSEVDASEATIFPKSRLEPPAGAGHYQHYTSPQKAAIHGAIVMADWQKEKALVSDEVAAARKGKRKSEALEMIPTRRDIFAVLGVSERSGYEIAASEKAGRHHNDSTEEEQRGRPQILTDADVDYLESFLWKHGFEGRTSTWNQLAEEVEAHNKSGIIVSGRTVQRVMGQKGWRHCIACQKSYVDPNLARRRRDWAEHMKRKYPKKEDWRKVRFSDEVHFSFGPQGRIHILRRPGERTCPDCIQEVSMPVNKKRKTNPEEEPEFDLSYKVHGWAAIAYNVKSELVIYDAGNSNGKMNCKTYVEQILEPHVGKWLDAGDDFVLEEDGDSGHGYGGRGRESDNIATKWKKKRGLKYYKNCAGAPDFVPIENGWSLPKANVRRHGHFDKQTLQELAIEGWAQLKQSTINEWVDSIPKRLQDCVDLGGKMTGW